MGLCVCLLLCVVNIAGKQVVADWQTKMSLRGQACRAIATEAAHDCILDKQEGVLLGTVYIRAHDAMYVRGEYNQSRTLRLGHIWKPKT